MPAVLLLDDAENLFLADDEDLFAVDLDFLTGVLAEKNRVARLDVERRDLAVLFDAAFSDGHDFALLRLLLGAVRDDDAAHALFFFFNALDDDAVVQWSHLHDYALPETGGAARDTAGGLKNCWGRWLGSHTH